MNFVILDMEWNGALSRKEKKFLNEIIEFGAVKFNEKMEITDNFSMLVKPQINKRISGKVKNLTHISNEELQGGYTFTHVLSKFRKFAGDSVIMTWGRSDIKSLIDNHEYYLKSERVDFMKKYADIQVYCEMCLGVDMTKQIGLQAAAEMLDICQDGVEHHRAYDDSLLTYECFKRLYDREKFLPYIEDATSDDFYGRMLFKTTVILDLNDPAIDKSQLFFDCAHCGKRAEQKSKWTLKNRSFRADFVCPSCGREFCGRIQFKQKYDGIVVSKKLIYKEDSSGASSASIFAACVIEDIKTCKVLLLNTAQSDAQGINEKSLPIGELENGESITQAVTRIITQQVDMETEPPVVCGILNKNNLETLEREIIFLYKAKVFEGDASSAPENQSVVWESIHDNPIDLIDEESDCSEDSRLAVSVPSNDLEALLKIYSAREFTEIFAVKQDSESDWTYL